MDDSEADPYGGISSRELRKMANARKITMTGGADEDDIRDQLRAHDLAVFGKIQAIIQANHTGYISLKSLVSLKVTVLK